MPVSASKASFFDPSQRLNVIMQDACLLPSLTGSQLEISLLPNSTPPISALTPSTRLNNSSLVIS